MSLTRRVARRELLRRSLVVGATLAGAGVIAACERAGAGLASPAATLPPPETATVRLGKAFACDPPLWLAKEFLLEEGFTDIQYVAPGGSSGAVQSRAADVGAGHPEAVVAAIDAGAPLVVLAGLHSGCQELWAAPGISSVRDLRGKRIAVFAKDPAADQFFAFFATALAYVGIDPLKEVDFYEIAPGYLALMNTFLDGRSDAFLAAGEAGAVMRRNPTVRGTKIFDQTSDKPWSQYLCCLLVANRDWTRQNPVAAKRVTRAILRAADATVKDRARAARDAVPERLQFLLPGGTAPEQVILNDTIAMLSFDWRELDPEETLRFFALRLGDVKLIKSTPQQIIANGSDLGFMRQLRKELKP